LYCNQIIENMGHDTMMVFSNQNLSNNFLDRDEIKTRCPFAYATNPTNPKVSEKYVQANTSTVIDDMMQSRNAPVRTLLAFSHII